VNPRHLAGPSLFLFFVVVGTLRLAADGAALRRKALHADPQNTWIFQASTQLSDVKGAMRWVQQPVCLVQQFRKASYPSFARPRSSRAISFA
jgi:hypothetical protein